MTYSRILIATDLSDASAEAATLALRIGHSRSRYRVVFVLPPPWPPLSNAPGSPPAREALELLREWARRWAIPEPELSTPTGSVAKEIAREADAFNAELVVVGHKGRSSALRRLLGSTARAIVRAAPTDTLVARGVPQPREPFLRSVVVATDFHAPSAQAADRAAQLAKRMESGLSVVHVVDPDLWYDPGVGVPVGSTDGLVERNAREKLSEFNRAHFQGRATEALLHGRTALALAAHARDHRADLLVIGNHGAGAIERAMLGSAAEAIVELAPCSVLVVRGG